MICEFINSYICIHLPTLYIVISRIMTNNVMSNVKISSFHTLDLIPPQSYLSGHEPNTCTLT